METFVFLASCSLVSFPESSGCFMSTSEPGTSPRTGYATPNDCIGFVQYNLVVVFLVIKTEFHVTLIGLKFTM